MNWFSAFAMSQPNVDLNWDTPAGRVLRALVAALPKNKEFEITVFGSAPLQLCIEPSFLSCDVDIFCDAEHSVVIGAIERAHLKEGQSDVYVQCCHELNFSTSPRWRSRARVVQVENCALILPQPIDILIGKLFRLEAKDLRAFRLVIERTDQPTEEVMLHELQAAVDLYRPKFDEDSCGDITTNTSILWLELWGREIDVRREIIAPALKRRREGYGLEGGSLGLKEEVRSHGVSSGRKL